MRALFFRIFLWFWVAVVVLAVTFASTIVATRYTTSREHLHAFKRALALSARAAAVRYQRLGVQGLRELINGGEGELDYVYFFDKQRNELQGLNAPPDVYALARAVLSGSSELRLSDKCVDRPPWIGCIAVDSVGAPYALVMKFRKQRLVSPVEWAILIPALVSIAGLVCFWLAKYLTSPFRACAG